jgi:pantothenate synthetase
LRSGGSHEGGILLVEYCSEASDVVVLSMVVNHIPEKVKKSNETQKYPVY